MSYSISTLLIRNLQEVFGENDPARRRVAVDELYTEDGVFYDPSKGVYRGRDEIDRIAGAIRATHPDFRYQPIAEPEESGNGGRVQWVSGRPGEAPAYAGTDFIIARDGRIAAVYLFFDKLNLRIRPRLAGADDPIWGFGPSRSSVAKPEVTRSKRADLHPLYARHLYLNASSGPRPLPAPPVRYRTTAAPTGQC